MARAEQDRNLTDKDGQSIWIGPPNLFWTLVQVYCSLLYRARCSDCRKVLRDLPHSELVPRMAETQNDPEGHALHPANYGEISGNRSASITQTELPNVLFSAMKKYRRATVQCRINRQSSDSPADAPPTSRATTFSEEREKR